MSLIGGRKKSVRLISFSYLAAPFSASASRSSLSGHDHAPFQLVSVCPVSFFFFRKIRIDDWWILRSMHFHFRKATNGKSFKIISSTFYWSLSMRYRSHSQIVDNYDLLNRVFSIFKKFEGGSLKFNDFQWVSLFYSQLFLPIFIEIL